MFFRRYPWAPALDRLEEVGLAVGDREHDDADVGQLRLDPPRGLETAHDRHRDVHQDDVGQQVSRQSQTLLAVARLSHDLEVLLADEQVGQPGAEQGVVVD